MEKILQIYFKKQLDLNKKIPNNKINLENNFKLRIWKRDLRNNLNFKRKIFLNLFNLKYDFYINSNSLLGSDFKKRF